MKKILFLFAAIFFFGLQLDAQIRLRTPDGRYVLLFDNGTWKYEEKVKVKEIKEVTPLQSVEKVAKPIVLKEATLDKQTVIKGESAKLAKFTEDKNTVKCDFQIISQNDKVILKTNWKILDGEGFRFFGFITKKSILSLELSNGTNVILPYADNFEPKEYTNYGFTIFSAELELNHEQIRKLQLGYVKHVSMKWSRRTESYNVFDPDYFVKELPKIIK
jgi:hypothetical protein